MANRPLLDSFGRRVTNLRISLTDRCDFRCVYCMPPEGIAQMPKSDYLSLDQLEKVVRLTGDMGVTRYRLTGGEPLLRRDIVEVVERLSALDSVADLSITTNASRLAKLAAPLRAAGLDRVNVSLDSLDPERFAAITRRDYYQQVRDGIEAALDEGLPVKINVVVMAGLAESEIIDFVEMAVARSIEVRFLEFMPLCGTGWGAERVLPIDEVRSIVQKHYRLEELARLDRPAQTFTVDGGPGRVGFIAPLSEPFCESCSRIRISASGRIRPCLFSEVESDLAPLLDTNDDTLAEAIRAAVWAKPAGSQFRDTPFREDAGENWTTQGALIRNIGG